MTTASATATSADGRAFAFLDGAPYGPGAVVTPQPEGTAPGSSVIADVAVVRPRKLAERLVAPRDDGRGVETGHRAPARAFPAA